MTITKQHRAGKKEERERDHRKEKDRGQDRGQALPIDIDACLNR